MPIRKEDNIFDIRAGYIFVFTLELWLCLDLKLQDPYVSLYIYV